jgi:ATP-binding cassette, subfamily B, bacterial MsbA
MKSSGVIKKLFPLLNFYPWAIPVIIILGILTSLSEGLGISLFIPFLQSLEPGNSQSASGTFLGTILNRLFIDISPSNRLLIIPLSIFGCVLLKNLLAYSSSLLSVWLYWRIGSQLVSKLFQQILSVSYSFLDSKQSGKLVNTLHTESWRACDAILLLVNIIINLSTVIVFVILLMLTSWQLTFLVAVALLGISLIIQQVTQQTKKLGREAVQANDRLVNRMIEGFYGMRVIRAFGQETYEYKRFEQLTNEVSLTALKLAKLYTISGPLSEVLSVALLVCIMIIALQNQANLPTLLTFIFMLYRLQPSVRKLDSDRVNLIGLLASVEDVVSLLEIPEQQFIRTGNVYCHGFKRSLTFKSVSFRYNQTDKPALNCVSFSITKGKTTAIVGPSGAGKSTLIGLICRFYDVTEGEIYVDEHPLRELDLASFRSHIAIVSQDIYVFNTTVRDNIAYGRLDATEAEIINAAKQANAHEFISKFPEGYDTILGDRGVRLSGGQRQRIALARAIIRDPQIFILDEATNALDSVSENIIQEAINTFGQNRTVIIIAHRLSTIEQADKILVLQEGRVVEQGNFPQLLQLNGLFSQLYHLQYGGVEN